METIWLREAGWRVLHSLIDLYLDDPLTHCYLLYDILYEHDSTRLLLGVEEGRVECYALSWSGDGVVGIILWGCCGASLLPHVLRARPAGGRVTIQPRMVGEEAVRRALRAAGVGVWDEAVYVDMVVDEDGFTPRMRYGAVRLGPGQVDDYVSLVSGWNRVPRSWAEKLLSRHRFYGVYMDGRLVAVAGEYLRLPEVWVVGSVYVHPAYRGRGLGSAVASAVTRDAVSSGATALLHVEEANTPARRMYRGLGYREVSSTTWFRLGGGG